MLFCFSSFGTVSGDYAFFAKSTDTLGADLQTDFFAVDNHSLVLEIRLPDFWGMALRKADIVAILFAFAGDITYLHRGLLYLFYPYKSTAARP
jgi:uncharacterized protein involved in propanediol utilization